jgi:hypothetical protein
MRRSVAILLALVLNWVLVLPAFAGSAESNLPTCCRKNGKHHCMMRVQSPSGSGASFVAAGGKCPYFPLSTSATHIEKFAPGIGQAIFAGIVRHPALSPQTEAGYRASYLRSKQKRGPPSRVLS